MQSFLESSEKSFKANLTRTSKLLLLHLHIATQSYHSPAYYNYSLAQFISSFFSFLLFRLHFAPSCTLARNTICSYSNAFGDRCQQKVTNIAPPGSRQWRRKNPPGLGRSRRKSRHAYGKINTSLNYIWGNVFIKLPVFRWFFISMVGNPQTKHLKYPLF